MTLAMRGNIRKLEQGCECQDDDCNHPATTEICLHADPMGDEWLPICDNHIEEYKAIVEGTIVSHEFDSPAQFDHDEMVDRIFGDEEETLSADEQYSMFDNRPLGVFCDTLLAGYVLNFNDVPKVAECDKHFNLNGPFRDEKYGNWVGFSAHWEDNQVTIAINLDTMVARWQSKESLNKLKLGAFANLVNRIRSWGYPIVGAEIAGL